MFQVFSKVKMKKHGNSLNGISHVSSVFLAADALIYLVDPACASPPTSKLTTVAWQPIHATVVSLHLVSSGERYRCTVLVRTKRHPSLLSNGEKGDSIVFHWQVNAEARRHHHFQLWCKCTFSEDASRQVRASLCIWERSCDLQFRSKIKWKGKFTKQKQSITTYLSLFLFVDRQFC